MQQTPEDSNLRLAVSVILQEGNRFLLVQRANDPGKGSFAFPGGKVEADETIEEAIKRELFEETALTLLAATLLEVTEVKGASGHYLLHIFHGYAYSGTPKAGDDAAAYGWYSLEEMLSLFMPQSMYDILPKLKRLETDAAQKVVF